MCFVVGVVGEKLYTVVILTSTRPVLLHLAQWFCFLCGLGLRECSVAPKNKKAGKRERRGWGGGLGGPV